METPHHGLLSPNLMEATVKERLDFGKMGYGCKHYRRRCKIPVTVITRHRLFNNPLDRHAIVRHDVKQTEKQQFHCDDCGICRVGGQENFFHCKKCGSCYSISLRDNHMCVENSMRHHCPICDEYLFDSLEYTIVMKCGHTMHQECYNEMIKRDKYCCPICSKSVLDMSRTWKRIDEKIEATVMPEDYRIRRFGYYVMTAITQQKFTYIFLAKNAVSADLIILVQLRLQGFLNDLIHKRTRQGY